MKCHKLWVNQRCYLGATKQAATLYDCSIKFRTLSLRNRIWNLRLFQNNLPEPTTNENFGTVTTLLDIHGCVCFCVCLFVSLHACFWQAAQYLTHCLSAVSTAGSGYRLGSTDTATYILPRTRINLAEHNFCCYGPAEWNSLSACSA